MEETYKDYLIRSFACLVSSGMWKPIAQINWDEGGEERVKLWMEWQFECSFLTEKEAEMEGHSFARKWIDNRESAVDSNFRSDSSDTSP